MTGAQIFCESLKNAGVEYIFGTTGASVQLLHDELKKHPTLKFIRCRHEQSAVHMANGYAKVSGQAGVVLVNSGASATNTVTGLATAHTDSVAIVCFTGQVPLSIMGTDAFQEADIVGITHPCTKHNFLVQDINRLHKTIREAFYIATTGRNGPVLVDLPRNLMMESTEFTHKQEPIKLRGYHVVTEGHNGQIQKALTTLLESKKPLILCGGGVVASSAQEELLELAEFLKIPVTTSLIGLGAFPGQHPQSLQFIGVNGNTAANNAIKTCDFLLAIGTRFDERATVSLNTFAKHAKIAHIDIDPSSISKNVRVDFPIVGDVKTVLRQMNILSKEKKELLAKFHTTLPTWFTEIASWQSSVLPPKKTQTGMPMKFVIETLHKVTEGKAILTTDAGRHQIATAHNYFFTNPRHWCTSGGLGTIGYGLPAALGACLADPKAMVFCITGTGSIQTSLNEFITAIQYHIPLKILILNSTKKSSLTPDFVKIAEAYGAKGIRCHHHDEIEPALRQALSTKTPILIEIPVIREEDVFTKSVDIKSA